MAWLTREDPRYFSRMPKEPDMDTLTYWITRLEPLIRAESDEEIIVVFCNRTGIEDDAVYAGTSAVVGIKDGEVSVYGMLGRGDKELLVVDTDAIPYAKLLYRPDDEQASVVPSSTDGGSAKFTPSSSTMGDQPEAPDMSPILQRAIQEDPKPSPTYSTTSASAGNYQQNAVPIPRTSDPPVVGQASRTVEPATQDYSCVPLSRRSNAGSDRSNRSVDGSVTSRHSDRSKSSRRSKSSSSRTRTSRSSTTSNNTGAQRPERPQRSQRSSSRKTKPRSPPIQIPPRGKESDTIPTPTGPSPTPLAIRPKLVIPSDAHKRAPVQHIPTPHPSAGAIGPRSARIYGGHVTIQHQNDILTPATAFEDITPSSPKFYWVPSDALLRTPMDHRIWTPALADSPTLNMRTPMASQPHAKDTAIVKAKPALSPAVERPQSRSSKSSSGSKSGSDAKSTGTKEAKPGREESRSAHKLRGSSRPRTESRSKSALDQRPDMATITQRLEALSPRPESAHGQQQEPITARPGSALARPMDTQDQPSNEMPERPSSPKSRNASRSRPTNPIGEDDPVGRERQGSVSRASIRIAASPSILDSAVFQKPSAIYRPDSRMSNAEASKFRPMSRAAHSRSNSMSAGYKTQTMNDIPRATSRGRQPGPRVVEVDSIDRSGSPQVTIRDCSIPGRRPSAPSFGFRSPDEIETEVRRVSPDEPLHAALRQASGDPDDEIIAEVIVRRSPSCAVHGSGQRGTPVEQGRDSPKDAANQDQEKASPQPSTRPSSAKSTPAVATSATQSTPSVSAVSPGMSVASGESAGSKKGSPASPQYCFDPKTPKAMMLRADGDEDSRPPMTPLSAPLFKQAIIAKCIEQEPLGDATRPKSSVW